MFVKLCFIGRQAKIRLSYHFVIQVQTLDQVKLAFCLKILSYFLFF